ncbi:MAG: SpoIVB peptidase S55 domain-containing protein [candidate division WOR-3 bacterium]
MNSKRWLLLLTLILALTFMPAYPGIKVMPVDEIRPGMKGTGYSVFSGTKPQEFDVEIIDVIHRTSPRGDLILARLAGAGLEKTGVIAGMSGSPVYIDGKLIGALAYAWSFAKEPIAGITPAAEMLKIWDLPDSNKTRGQTRTSPLERSNLNLPPIPLAISGFNKRLEEIITPNLSRLGFQPVAAGIATDDVDTADLVPGGAVGVALLDGDVRAAAVGTITHREGNRILAFGHPLFLAGATRLPMTGGRIHTVLPSLEISHKMFSPTRPIGIINQDRMTGISGIIGPQAPMIPVNVYLRSSATDDTYRFRVVDQEQLTPDFLPIGLINIILETEGLLEEYTIESRMRLYLKSPAPAAEIRHIFTGTDAISAMFSKINSELKMLFANPLEEIALNQIEAELHFNPGRKSAQLVSARPDRTRVKPGETLSVRLRLRDYRGEESEREITIPIPATTPSGTIAITITTRDEFFAAEMGRANKTLEPTSLKKLLKLLAETGREDELIVAGFARTAGLTVGDKELPQPPPSLRQVLLATKSVGEIQPLGSSLLFKQVVKMDRVILGSANFELEVK